MTPNAHVLWHVVPLSLPQPQRHCSTCGTSRPFHCSGKVRLNANGRRLDAWLIYKCSSCDRTWNLPILERVPVAEVPSADLAAMQVSDPDWVWPRAFDLVALRRHALRVILPEDLAVTRRVADPGTLTGSRIALAVEALWPTGLRLDRLLAQELCLTRSFLQQWHRTGGLLVATGSLQALKLPLARSTVLCFDLDRIADQARSHLIQALGLPPPGAG